jgi:hypothetical protein
MPFSHTQLQIKAKSKHLAKVWIGHENCLSILQKSGMSVNFVFVFYRLNSTFLAIFTALFKMQLNLLDSEGFFLTLLPSSSFIYSLVFFFIPTAFP